MERRKRPYSIHKRPAVKRRHIHYAKFRDESGAYHRRLHRLHAGLGNREIAEKLFVSMATVKTHVHNIYKKTGVKGRYELFRLTTPVNKETV